MKSGRRLKARIRARTGKVTSTQVLTDTGNTGAEAEAYYGDIVVGAALR